MTRIVPALGPPEEVISTVFGCRPGDVAENVILTPFVPLRAFRDLLQEPMLDLAPPFFFKGISARRGNCQVTVLHTGVGPSRVGDCLGFLSLTPARRALFVGAVGGLRQEHSIGDFFVPTEAADGEGYTRYVEQPFEEVVRSATTVPRPQEAHSRMEDFLRAKGCTVQSGRVFTVGSISFESEANLRSLARFGYDALEMELSAFYAAGKRHGFDVAALTYISDLPLESPLWSKKEPREWDALRRAYRALPLLALDYLCGE